MPFKRPAPPLHEPSSGYDSSKGDAGLGEIETPSKRSKVSRSAKALPEINLYIVQAKLNGPDIAELFTLAERHCGRLCGDIEDANVVLTAVTMRRRFERHVSWELAKTKAIVTPSWLKDSVVEGRPLPCGGYVAFPDLLDETVRNCPACEQRPCICEDTADEKGPAGSPVGEYPSPPTSPSSSIIIERVISSPPSSTNTKIGLTPPRIHVPQHLLPPPVSIPTRTELLSWSSLYTCQRASPLLCPNQALAVELDIIKRSRALEGEERSVLSYARAIAAVKAYPDRITSRKQINEIPYCGTKISNLVEEFVDHGHISEARSIASSERFQCLSLFSSVYGIGPSNARRLYALGVRTVEDLEVYYGVEPEEAESQLVELEHKSGEGFGQKFDTGLGETWIKIALGLRKDLQIKIPRDEVEEMNRVVMHELDELEPGCVSTIAGGYRRGKPESNDVDIVFTHPDPEKVKGLCKRLVKRLYERGMVTHVMHLSSFHSHNPLKNSHWDSLEKSLTVFVLPQSSSYYRGIRRRLDLIVALPEVYWTAVIGWSGSIMFQRDLRQWAKDKMAMKFDSSGITRRYDSKSFFPKTEKEAFDLLGLEWVDPTQRNADV
ncbi:Nucleotidyltransferase [Trametopsis cervina]|nr:Nucleotidyltransferase [Trametopsis cervina]